MFQQLQSSKISPLPIVLIIQLILIYWVYQPFFSQGEEVIFCANHDGLKNYFTYFTYLTQDENTAADFYTQMQYPYGEYIFYTDNTPTLAIPLKWFSNNIVDITPYAFRIFNWFCLLGILLSTLFSWLILKRLTKNIWLWSVLAVTLPWLTSQMFRIGFGHFNLGFSWTYILTFYLLMLIYEYRDNWKKVLKVSLILWVSVYLIAFIHLYYLPMLCAMIGTFGLVIAIWERKNKKKALVWFFSGFGLALVSLLSVWLTIRLNDSFYPLRKKVEKAYNWSEWNLKIDGLYSNYDFSTIPSILQSNLLVSDDSESYLGTFAIYGLLFLLVWLIVKTIQNRKQFKSAFKTYFSGEKGAMALLIFFAGLMCLNIAIGEYAKMFNNKLSFDNPLHPFKYARLIAGEVTQFRVLARFNWACFWAFNFTIIYLFDQFFERHKQNWIRGFIVLLTLLSVVDMVDMQGEARKALNGNPLTSPTVNEPIRDLLKDIDTKKYQAILPLPFYAIGSEVDDMMLMAEDNWRTRTFALSIQADLPLMASNLSRSAVVQHEALLSIFTEKGINNHLKERLDKRPILVFMTNKEAVWNVKFENEQVNKYLQYGKKVPAQYNMKLLKTTEEWSLFEWKVED